MHKQNITRQTLVLAGFFPIRRFSAYCPALKVILRKAIIVEFFRDPIVHDGFCQTPVAVQRGT